ncbi:MAG: hypothetical protein ACREUT_20555 [Steroidobacteraceae bacterium]
MTEESNSTRRSFLKGGALLAAPIAAASLSAVALAGDGPDARLRRLENEAAIRELHRSWLRQVNAAGGDALLDDAVRRITADHAGAPDRIDIAADGRSAIGHFDCAVELETPLADDCTLTQMSRAQGTGTTRRSERRMLRVDYTKRSGAWQIARLVLTAL